ncbi:MAG: DUF3280 domain-containing protein [Rhodomicrobium sp.]
MLILGVTRYAQAAALPRIAIFGFELIDTSLQGSIYGTSPAEKARLDRLAEALRKSLAESGRFQVVDIGPVEEAAHASNLQSCGGCDADLARKVDADFSITGTVQKVSELILNVNLYIRDVSTGNLITSMSADMRGNTDESWSRALNWLVRYRLLAPNFGQH